MKKIVAAQCERLILTIRLRSYVVTILLLLSLILILSMSAGRVVQADSSTGNVTTGSFPYAVAVNPVTNKIYVANDGSASVTVINGTNNSTITVPGRKKSSSSRGQSGDE